MVQVLDRQRIDQIPSIVEQVKAAQVYSYALLSGPSELPEKAGIYFIWNRVTGQVLYVGKTMNLRRRLYSNHLMGSVNNARLKKYLMDDPDLPEVETLQQAKEYIKTLCSFSFILEEDMRKRGHLEGLISYLCNCKYVDKEH